MSSVEPHRVRAAAEASDGVAFGEFVLEPTHRQVWRRDGVPVPLTPRLFNALQLFVEHPGELLDKEWLLDSLWPGLVVEENSLSQVISALRRALGDDGQDRRYILTEPRRGFRFVADVSAWRRPPSNAGIDADAAKVAPSAGVPGPAIAVLPFVSLTADGRDDLLEVGMADSLISRLSALPGLVVRSIGSVRRFGGLDQDALAAARSLDVGWLVEGSIQRRGEQLRVSARLLSAPDGTSTWSGSFNEKISSVFDVQDTIAQRIADALVPRLAGAAPFGVAAAEGGTRNIEAYQHYLAGLQQAQGIRADMLARSLEEFQHAIAIDPGYALARVAMAESYRRMVFGADCAPDQVLAPSRQWVLEVLTEAPRLADAHCQLAWILNWYDYDWAASAREFRQALALNPNLALAHFGLGFLLVTLGRNDEGLGHVHKACELDPMQLLFNTMYGCFLVRHGQHEAGHAKLRWALEVEPRFWVAHSVLASLRMTEGDLDGAIAAARRAQALSDQSTQATAALGALLASAGRADEARAELAGLQALADRRYVPPTSPAAVLAALGEHDAALELLERAFEVRDTRLIYLKDDWRWNPLRGEARFTALRQRMRLDGYGPGLLGP